MGHLLAFPQVNLQERPTMQQLLRDAVVKQTTTIERNYSMSIISVTVKVIMFN